MLVQGYHCITLIHRGYSLNILQQDSRWFTLCWGSEQVGQDDAHFAFDRPVFFTWPQGIARSSSYFGLNSCSINATMKMLTSKKLYCTVLIHCFVGHWHEEFNYITTKFVRRESVDGSSWIVIHFRTVSASCPCHDVPSVICWPPDGLPANLFSSNSSGKDISLSNLRLWRGFGDGLGSGKALDSDTILGRFPESSGRLVVVRKTLQLGPGNIPRGSGRSFA